MSTLTTNRVVNHTGDGVDIDGLAKIEDTGKNICSAWVNFDGTTTPPTIRDSYNVSSVTDTAFGKYTITFTVAMDNENYAIAGITGNWQTATTTGYMISNDALHGVSSCSVRINSDAGADSDRADVSLIIFGGKD